MKCPRCVQRMHSAATSCPHCGFTMADVDELFGNEDVALKKLSDSAGVLRMKERAALRKILSDFERRFPQLFFSIYIAAFDEIPSLRQFGFWLLNRAAYSDVDIARPNENGILIVVDVNGKGAAMTFGYALMPYLNEDNTFDALSAAHPYLLQGEYLKAFKLVIGRIEGSLKKGWRRVRRDPESLLGASGQQPRPVDQILQRIREGNQEVGSEKVEEAPKK
ncbi:TPM domain-containing protein [Akkermansiaceae bacterium]|nr:TPM domain-containing protein [Akkermansiaceae bacterium]